MPTRLVSFDSKTIEPQPGLFETFPEYFFFPELRPRRLLRREQAIQQRSQRFRDLRLLSTSVRVANLGKTLQDDPFVISLSLQRGRLHGQIECSELCRGSERSSSIQDSALLYARWFRSTETDTTRSLRLCTCVCVCVE